MSSNRTIFLEIKNGFNQQVVDLTMPHIYEGLRSIYSKAKDITRKQPNQLLYTFQTFLKGIVNWNVQQINDETQRIRIQCGSNGFYDNLIKAVMKSNIVLLTCSKDVSNQIETTFYNNFQTSTFVHACYVECAKCFWNTAYLFFHHVTPLEYKRNQVTVQHNINVCIEKAIRSVLPISDIVKEYLEKPVTLFTESDNIELCDDKMEEDAIILSVKKPKNEVIDLLNSDNARDKIMNILNIDKIMSEKPIQVNDRYRINHNLSKSDLLSPKHVSEPVRRIVSPPINKNSPIDHHIKSHNVRQSNRQPVNRIAQTEKAPSPLIINFDDTKTNEQTYANSAPVVVTRTNGMTGFSKLPLEKVRVIEQYGTEKFF